MYKLANKNIYANDSVRMFIKYETKRKTEKEEITKKEQKIKT